MVGVKLFVENEIGDFLGKCFARSIMSPGRFSFVAVRSTTSFIGTFGYRHLVLKLEMMSSMENEKKN